MKESAKKDSLSCRQATLILTYLLIGSAPISGIAKVANNNAPLSILGGALLIVPFYFLLYKMAITYNKNNIFEIAQLVFGKIIGKLIITALIFNTLYITIISYRLIIDFIQTAGLLNTNNLSIIFILCLISIQITKGGLKLYGKWAEFFFILIALGFCFLLITVLPVVKPKSFFPLFYDGFSNFYEGSLEVFCLPFSLSFISLSFFSQLPQKENTGKVLLKALPIATITLSITTLISIMTIGGKYSKTFYPLYLATRRIMLGQLIQRIELNLMQIFIIIAISRLITLQFSTLIGLKTLLNLSHYSTLAVPVIFLCGILSIIAYENPVEIESAKSDFLMPYSIIMHIALPLIIYLGYLVKFNLLKTQEKD